MLTRPVLALEVADRFSAPEWDRLMGVLDGGFFHSSAWVRHRCADGRTVPRYFVWRDAESGAVRAAAPGFVQPAPDRLLGRLFGRVHFNTPPASDRAGMALIPSIIEWMREVGSLTAATLGVLDGRRPWMEGDPPNPNRSLEFVVRAGSGLAPQDGARRSINKAHRLGVEVVVADTPEQIDQFAILARGLHERLRSEKAMSLPSIEPASAARAWSELITSGAARLYLASLAGEPITASLFGLFGGRAYGLQAGASEAARRTGATHLVLATALEDLFSGGFDEVNLGSVAARASESSHVDHGLFMFKKHLGSTMEPRVGGVVVVRRLRSRVLACGIRMRGLR
jgi:hypothetical protein